MEAEDDYGNEQEAYWDGGHEKLQGEDDGGVVGAVSSMVTCKTKEENSFSGSSHSRKGHRHLCHSALGSAIRGPVLGNFHSFLLFAFLVDVRNKDLDTPDAHSSISRKQQQEVPVLGGQSREGGVWGLLQTQRRYPHGQATCKLVEEDIKGVEESLQVEAARVP